MTAIPFIPTRTPPVDLTMVRPSVVYVLMFAAVGTYFPYSSVVLASRGLPISEIGLLLALSGVVSLVAAPIWGTLADRAGDAGRVLLVAGAAGAAGAVLLALSHEVAQLAIALSILAAGTAGMVPMLDARAIDLAGERRERFSRARAWGSLAFIGASVVTGSLVAAWSIDVLFALYAPLLLATGVAGWRLLGTPSSPGRAARPNTGRSAVDALHLVRGPGLALLLVATTLIWTATGAAQSFISVGVVEQGGDAGMVGLVWGAGAAVEVPVLLLFPLLAARFGAPRLALVGAVAFAVRALGWAIGGDPLVDVLVAPVGGLGFALFYAALVSVVANAVPGGSQATAQGLFSGMTFNLGSVVGAAVGGVLAPIVGLFGLAGVFGGSAVLVAVSAVLLWRAVVSVTSTDTAATWCLPPGDALPACA